ncbi:MAG TPA: DUF1501 domain-containing protein [Pirellulales bacterium]|jgi:hypothetical protein|nr:DUF1501 domain-containing protein [Pirellulales bacterium]
MLNIERAATANSHMLSRRSILRAGGAGLLGLSLPRVLAAETATPAKHAKAKNVIFLLLYGGPSQLETFDLKPLAASKIRGPFKPIASRTPELRICELMPNLAAVSDKFSVIRTMTHPYNDHSSAGHYIQTGRPWHVPIGGGFNATEKDWPAYGSVVDYLDERAASSPRQMPGFVYLPNRLGHLQTYSSRLDRPGQYAGWLGRGYDPMATRIRKRDDKDNPFFRECTDAELDFNIQGLALEADLTLERLQSRRSLVDQFDDARRKQETRGTAAFDQFRERALTLVSSAAVRTALDISREAATTRDRYGRHLFGQSTLVARRLVEAGTRFVTVGWDAPDGYGWDSHLSSNDVKDHLVPALDQTLSALLVDLDQRGLLEETLVVAIGEMGRTPKANANWGRDHWSTLFPAVVAGGGIRNGRVYGTTDRDAAYALDHPTKPEDLAATIFELLGIDPELRISDQQGRPVPLVEGGQPIRELIA